MHTSNEKKILFGPNCEKVKNAFERLSQNQNEISDANFLVDYHDDYLTENNKERSFSKAVPTFGCTNLWKII